MLPIAQKQIKHGSSPPLKLHRCERCDERGESLRNLARDLGMFSHLFESDLERDLDMTDVELKRIEGMIKQSVTTLLDAWDLVRFYEHGGEA
jgi:hypothetical protein